MITNVEILSDGDREMGREVKVRVTTNGDYSEVNYIGFWADGIRYWGTDIESIFATVIVYPPDYSDKKTEYNFWINAWSASGNEFNYNWTVFAPSPKIHKFDRVTIGTNKHIQINEIAKGLTYDVSLVLGTKTIDLFSFGYEDIVKNPDEGLLLPTYPEGIICGTYSTLLGHGEIHKIDYDICKYFKNTSQKSANLVCNAYFKGNFYKKDEITVILDVPENDITKPAIDSIKFSPITSCTDALAPLYIRGKTGLNANISATSAYSDIAEYEVTAGSVGAKGNPGIIDVLANDGTVPVTVKVTDARGFSRTVAENIYVYPYSRPKIVPYTGYSDIVCERAKATGELHSDGTYLAIMAGKRFTSIVKDGAELNSCRLRYRFKPTTVDTFGDWVTLLADGSAETEIKLLAGNVVSNTNASYDIELSAIDLVGSEHVIRFSVMTSAISFVLYDGVDGAAFGKYPEEPHVVDIAQHMTLRVRGRLEVLGSSWESLGLADGMEESPYAYGRQDDTGCYYQVSNGNHVQAAFNCSYDYAGRSMVVNKTPIPEEYRPERTVCSICPTNDRRLALVTVQPDGYIRIEWVQTIASTSNTTSATVLWVDGYLDYWV